MSLSVCIHSTFAGKVLVISGRQSSLMFECSKNEGKGTKRKNEIIGAHLVLEVSEQLLLVLRSLRSLPYPCDINIVPRHTLG